MIFANRLKPSRLPQIKREGIGAYYLNPGRGTFTSGDMQLDINFYKSFTKDEYIKHIGKLQNSMKDCGVDILLLTMPENIYYATGYRTWYSSSLFRPVICILGQHGEPYLILRILEKTTVKLYAWTDNIICWGTPSRNLGILQAETIVDALRQIFCESNMQGAVKIGLEAGDGLQYYCSLKLLGQITDAFPDKQFVDGSLAVQLARMVKTPWEISCIRLACKAAESAILETCMAIKDGKTTEKDISCNIAKLMAEKGVDKISYLTVISGNEKYSTFNAYATERVIQKGDIVLVDISGHINGYASDLTRVFHIGEAPDELLQMSQAAFDSVKAGAGAFRPGITVDEISRVCEDYIKNAGYPGFVVHSSGHGIGLGVVEYPIIQDNCEVELQEGMVFAVEQGVYPFDPEKGAEHITMCLRYEDQIMVTANAYEFLSGPGKALYIVK